MTNPKPEPVAYIYRHKNHLDAMGTLPLTEGDKADGWTETPLYPASALDEAYRRGLSDAVDVTHELTVGWHDHRTFCGQEIERAIRALEIKP